MNAVGRPAGLFVGLATLDAVYRVERPPGPNGKVNAYDQQLAAGGPAANAAVTFAGVGGRAALLTALGRHELARYVAADLVSCGVAVEDAVPGRTDPPAMSSVCVVAGTGERSVVSANASGIEARPPDGLEAWIGQAQVLMLDGHHSRLAVAAATAARAAEVPVILDGGSWKPVLDELLAEVDVAVCSSDFRVPGTRGIEQSAAALLERGVPAVAFTRGGDPVRWWTAQHAGEVAVPQVRALDTLGAGDVFHGAFSFAVAVQGRRDGEAGQPDGEAGRRDGEAGRRRVASGRPRGVASDADPFRRALAFAARVAALRCTVPGPRAWLGTGELASIAISEGNL